MGISVFDVGLIQTHGKRLGRKSLLSSPVRDLQLLSSAVSQNCVGSCAQAVPALTAALPAHTWSCRGEQSV